MIDDTIRQATPAGAARIARLFPSYRDFVDDALFHPAWGYYSTGAVRFGEGGHYDTYPLALSPYFGRMLAQYAHGRWRRAGEPGRFEICELGAGNGQLCADVLLWVQERSRHERTWRRFAAALSYRIIERSPALLARQQQHLGPLAERVRWKRGDLATAAVRGTPLAPAGLVFANEVLDCLAHHKVVPQANGKPAVVFVIPHLRTVAGARRGAPPPVQSRPIPRIELAKVLADAHLRGRLDFEEVLLPVESVSGLRPFLRRHYPELFIPGATCSPYFACPAIERMVENASRLYARADLLWIDYGGDRAFHLTTAESRRVFAGPPRSRATIYEAPGRNDITFMVDFSVVRAAAERAGLRVQFYGPQAELARCSGMRLDRHAVDLMVRYRALGWMLAVIGVGPERHWRRNGLTWTGRPDTHVPVRNYVKRAVAEFLATEPSDFKLLILRRE